MQTSKYEALKLNKKNNQYITDSIVIEAPLQININEEPYTVVMRTPGNDQELIRGLLYAEDIYKSKNSLSTTLVETTDNHFSIFNIIIPNDKLGKGYMNKRSLLSVSSCGICGKQSIDDIKVIGTKLISNNEFDFSKIEEMFNQMQKRQILFSKTGASHAAAIFNSNYSLLSIMEDIGRHNAVDKVIGELINNNQLKDSSYLLVSGRVSYEIVTKAFIAKIKTIIAVSGCSSLAIDFAKEFGIQLLGFTRDERTTIYSQ